MTDLDSNIRYVFTMTDNVSQSTDAIADSAVEAQNQLHQVQVQQEQVTQEVDKTTTALSKQQSQFLVNTAVLMSMQSAVSSVSNGLISMGVVTGDAAKQLQTLNAGFQVLTGFVQGVQALQAVSEMLKTSEMGLALVETFRSVMESPWKAALVGIGVGAAGGALAAMLASSGSSSTASATTTNSTIVINNTASDSLSTANGINAIISGGRVL